jgi:hypothetical protein
MTAARLIAAALDVPIFLVMRDNGESISWFDAAYVPVAVHWEDFPDDKTLAPETADLVVMLGRGLQQALDVALYPESADRTAARQRRHLAWLRKTRIVTDWLAQTGPEELDEATRLWLPRRAALGSQPSGDREATLAWELAQSAPSLAGLREAFMRNVASVIETDTVLQPRSMACP